jgi:hypothetical protein
MMGRTILEVVETLNEREEMSINSLFEREEILEKLSVGRKKREEEENRLCRICLCGKDEG